MLTIRCPECQLRLPLETEELEGRVFCPGCNTLFQFDQSTGVFTIFTEEKPRSLDKDDIPEKDNDSDGVPEKAEGVPAGFVEAAADAERNLEKRDNFAYLFFLTVLGLGAVIGGVRAALAPTGQRTSAFFEVVVIAAAVGCIIPLIIMRVLRYFDVAQHIGRRAFRLGPKEPDFDEIADRLNDGMIRRRPLSADDSVRPQIDAVQSNEQQDSTPD